eukprot:TRINITY_DN22618_c0_g1_i5.p1 TRINITY_DN22618_c0_g1~~TRINITY_DN22618_c0_g1_i5.p1  ORF type:complete len:212 (+),score=52.27 TRINITY_DN22618_c0_g1_i5:465-1100(+)
MLQKTLEKKFVKSCQRSKRELNAKGSGSKGRQRNSSNSFRYTSMGTVSKVEVNKTADIPSGKSLLSSKTICNLLSFDLPTILDAPLDEDSPTPTKNEKETAMTSAGSKFESGRMSIGVPRDYKTLRQKYLDKKNKLSVDLSCNNMNMKKPRRSLIRFNEAKKKPKLDADENARRHLVRSHLNKLYTKIMMVVRTKEKERRHSIIVLKTKHK